MMLNKLKLYIYTILLYFSVNIGITDQPQINKDDWCYDPHPTVSPVYSMLIRDGLLSSKYTITKPLPAVGQICSVLVRAFCWKPLGCGSKSDPWLWDVI